MGGRPVIPQDRSGHSAQLPEARAWLWQRDFAEHFLNSPQVAHSRLGRTADPPAHGLYRNTELTCGRFLRQPFPAERARHPLGECLRLLLCRDRRATRAGLARRIRRYRVQPGGGLTARRRPVRRDWLDRCDWLGSGGRRCSCGRACWGEGCRCAAVPASPATGWPCRSAGRLPRHAQGKCGRQPESSRSARPRRAARGRPSRRPRGCLPRSAGTQPGTSGRSP